MLKNIVRVLVLVLFLVGLSSNAYAAYKNGDLQVWNIDVEEIKLVKKIKIALEEEFHWSNTNQGSKFCYQHYDAGLLYDVNKYLSIGGGYRQIFEYFSTGNPKLTRFNNRFLPDYCPYIVGILSGDLYGFSFTDRNRLEYNNFDHKTDYWRYRNKLTIKTPWKFTRFEIQPYISDEAFVVFSGVPSDINQNRFQTGIGTGLTKNMKLELYYMRQSVKLSVKNPDKWLNANVLGFTFKVNF
jgi:hypothetical protein